MSQLGEGTDWGPAARVHRAALELLRQAITTNSKELKTVWGTVDLKIDEAVKEHLGDLNHLIQEHGSLANAMTLVMEAGTTSVKDVVELRSKMGTFRSKLQAYAEAADVSKEYMMSLLTKVLDITHEGAQRAVAQMQHIEQLLGHGTRGSGGRPPTPPPPPPLRRGASSPSAAANQVIDGDTPLGTVQVGGSDTALTVKLLFQMIRESQAKVDVLTERSKNAGVFFDRRAFSSEAEFVAWYVQRNPSGSGPAAFVDIIPIWLFSTTDTADPSAFLTDLHQAKNTGFKGGSEEVRYTHSMTTHYPAVFMGKDKSPILSMMTIKMLESYEA